MKSIRVWLALSFLMCPLSIARAQVSDWQTKTQAGEDPLQSDKQWDADTARQHLAVLLPQDLTLTRNYIVVVAANKWTELYLVRSGCFTISSGKLQLLDSCDLAATRVFNSDAVTVVGIKPFTEAVALEWTHKITSRPRLKLMAFASYVLPAILAGIAPAASGEYKYQIATEQLSIKSLPVDIEVAATASRNIAGQQKKDTAGRTFNDYPNEYVTLGVGAAIQKVNEINLDLAQNKLTAQDITKLKTYGLINLHPVAVDPEAPGMWQLPHAVFGIEISSKHFNYGFGVGWGLPFIKNTSLAVLRVNALPDTTDTSAGQTGTETRTWMTAYMIQYAFPLPKS